MIHEICIKFQTPTKQRFQRLVRNDETEEPIFKKGNEKQRNSTDSSDGNSRSMLWFIILIEMLLK